MTISARCWVHCCFYCRSLPSYVLNQCFHRLTDTSDQVTGWISHNRHLNTSNLSEARKFDGTESLKSGAALYVTLFRKFWRKIRPSASILCFFLWLKDLSQTVSEGRSPHHQLTNSQWLVLMDFSLLPIMKPMSTKSRHQKNSAGSSLFWTGICRGTPTASQTKIDRKISIGQA